MSEGTATSESTETAATATGTEATEAATATVDHAAEAEKWKALSRKNEDKAKANADKAKKFDDLVASQATEQEKAVTEAKAAGRIEALREAGSKLVAAELKAAVAGRIDPTKLEALFGGLNTASFLTDEGETIQIKDLTGFAEEHHARW